MKCKKVFLPAVETVLQVIIMVLSLSATASASTVAFLEASQTITNTSDIEQTYNFVNTLPTDNITGSHTETASAAFSLLDSDASGSASITVNQWHGLIDPIQGPPPLFDLTLLFKDSFSCSGVIACSKDTVTTTTATQLHSELDHLGNPVRSNGIHLNFTLSPGDTVIFNSTWELAPVPLPAAFWLFFSGIITVLGFAHKRKSE